MKEQAYYISPGDVNKLTARIKELEAEIEALKHPAISLPKITQEISDEYSGTELIERNFDKWGWSQTAVDFACLLNGVEKCND